MWRDQIPRSFSSISSKDMLTQLFLNRLVFFCKMNTSSRKEIGILDHTYMMAHIGQVVHYLGYTVRPHEHADTAMPDFLTHKVDLIIMPSAVVYSDSDLEADEGASFPCRFGAAVEYLKSGYSKIFGKEPETQSIDDELRKIQSETCTKKGWTVNNLVGVGLKVVEKIRDDSANQKTPIVVTELPDDLDAFGNPRDAYIEAGATHYMKIIENDEKGIEWMYTLAQTIVNELDMSLPEGMREEITSIFEDFDLIQQVANDQIESGNFELYDKIQEARSMLGTDAHAYAEFRKRIREFHNHPAPSDSFSKTLESCLLSLSHSKD